MKLYRHLDRTRYQMDFCINNPNRQFYEGEITELGGKVYRIPPKSAGLNEFKRALSAVVKDNGYRHVLRVTSNAMGFLDLKIAHDAGAEVCAARSSNASDGTGWKPWLAHRLGRLLYGKYVNVKIAPSDLAAKYTFGNRAYEGGEVKMLRNAIDLSAFHYDPVGRKSVRAEFGIPEGTKIVGHVGRFQEQKNHSYLIKVFSELCKRMDDARLLLVGEECETASCVRRFVNELGLGSRVIFAGVRRDIPQLLSAMDVFVFPSRFEGMPNTVIEAQAAGLPCVIADTITREADITGLVTYLPIVGNPVAWCKPIVAALSQTRRNDLTADFIRAGYEITSSVREFERIIWGAE